MIYPEVQVRYKVGTIEMFCEEVIIRLCFVGVNFPDMYQIKSG